jgi:hypothetical protein
MNRDDDITPTSSTQISRKPSKDFGYTPTPNVPTLSFSQPLDPYHDQDNDPDLSIDHSRPVPPKSTTTSFGLAPAMDLEESIQMTTFRRPSVAASSSAAQEKDKFRRGHLISSASEALDEGAGELPTTDADQMKRGTIDGGFGWVIVACS